jgi:hypothetical protein
VPDTKLPWTPQGKLTQAQDAVRQNDAYQWSGNEGDPTFCNVATGETIKAIGGPLDDLRYSPGGNYRVANDAANKLQGSKDWQQVSPTEAQDLANQGVGVIGVQPNWERDENGKYKHVTW